MMPTQQVPIAPSVRLAVLLCAAHVGAVGAVWATPVPVAVKAIIVGAIALSLIHHIGLDAALHAADAIVALEIREGGGIAFLTRSGGWHDCELLGSSFVSRHLTIVNLKPGGRQRTRHVILMPDNVDARDFRRLRMWLRWAAERSPGSGPGSGSY
ncbi:MAG: hypothetical protein HYV99_01825 [Betaproteobacteria bacterium]|nr:hypothetical protein [Betaproteobacteria bacterium]